MEIKLSEETLENIKKDLLSSYESSEEEVYKDLLDIAEDYQKNGYGIVMSEIMSKYILVPKS